MSRRTTNSGTEGIWKAMRLDEITKPKSRKINTGHLKPWMFKTREEIQTWMDKCHIDGHIDRMDLSVHPTNPHSLSRTFNISEDEVLVDYKGTKYLPVAFHHSVTNFDFGFNIHFENFYGFPPVAYEGVTCRAVKLNDRDRFKGMSKYIKKTLRGYTTTSISNFEGLEECYIEYMSFGASRKSGAMIDTIKGLPETLIELELYNVRSISGLAQQCPRLTSLQLGGGILTGHLTLFLYQHDISVGANTIEDPELHKACQIINKHLHGDKDMLDCQEELRSAGLREYGRP